MNHVDFWNFVLSAIETDGKAAIVKVADSKGSSPGKQKFMMVVDIHGRTAGTIGGGVMEHNVINSVMTQLQKDQPESVVQLLIHRKDVPESSGLICSGSQTNLIVPLNRTNIHTLQAIANAVRKQVEGTLIINPTGIEFVAEVAKGLRTEFVQSDNANWEYHERYGKPETVYVVGSGHVGLAICKLLTYMGMHVICFDPRKDAPTVSGNKYADSMIITPYNEIGKYVEDSENSYILIVTSAGDTDNIALQQVIQKEFRFLGLMGSASKKQKIFKDLRAVGIDDSLLAKVCTPIGIPMNSFTPDEIAVSIAAQIIHIRNGGV